MAYPNKEINDGPYGNFMADPTAATLGIYRRCKFVDPTTTTPPTTTPDGKPILQLAAADEVADAITMQDIRPGKYGAIRFCNAGGETWGIMAGDIGCGEPIYADAAGKVTADTSGLEIGLTTSVGADGSPVTYVIRRDKTCPAGATPLADSNLGPMPFLLAAFEGLPGLTSIVDNRTTTAEGADVDGCSDLATYSAPNLASVTDSAYFTMSGNGALVSVSLPVLVEMTDLTLSDNPALTSVALPLLGTAKSINISNNAALASVSFPQLAVLSGNLAASGGALDAASVNGILALLVAATTDGSTPWANAVTLNGGTSAAPTGQGILDSATLTGRGASVFTN